MLEKLKLFLGLEGEETDALLSFSLDCAKETIVNYCNIGEVPEGLSLTWIRMAADFYQNELQAAEDSDGVSSISLGDTTVAFGTKTGAEQYMGSVLKNYKVQLNRYRKAGFQ